VNPASSTSTRPLCDGSSSLLSLGARSRCEPHGHTDGALGVQGVARGALAVDRRKFACRRVSRGCGRATRRTCRVRGAGPWPALTSQHARVGHPVVSPRHGASISRARPVISGADLIDQAISALDSGCVDSCNPARPAEVRPSNKRPGLTTALDLLHCSACAGASAVSERDRADYVRDAVCGAPRLGG
jgi:hypothetical protein